MSHRLTAILEFDTGALREFLQLPETAEIVDARMDFSNRGRLQLKIEGAGFPTQEGGPIQPTTCIVHMRHEADGSKYVERIEWPFGDGFGGNHIAQPDEAAKNERARAMLDDAGPPVPAPCTHEWVANSGAGGTPVFNMNRQMSTEPVMHVTCARCNARTWMTALQWAAVQPCGQRRENWHGVCPTPPKK